jgi:uncharacterized protein YgbK (DUF1537 family)
MLIGCIADDFTGASDIGNMLARAGMSTTLCIGVPDPGERPSTDAVVLALKTRSLSADKAVAASRSALDWLVAQDCRQVYFKYCSTFDSTPRGNIGPVLDALSEALGVARVVVVPAFPGTGRRVFMGHLFVNDQLLSRSGMEHHPLTPMTEPDLRRWLALQTRAAIGHVDAATVRAGRDAIGAALADCVAAGQRYVVVDTTDDTDLHEIGAAVAQDRLVSGGSGLALGLPANFAGMTRATSQTWQGRDGRAVALSGSCSLATQAQVTRHAAVHPTLQLDPRALLDGSQTVAGVADWVMAQDAAAVPLVSSTMPHDALAAVQQALGRDQSAAVIEQAFGDIAVTVVGRGIARLIVGGGETSGAVVGALGIRQARIGPEIAPGVPALKPHGADFVCTLKSGNFGDERFFETAARVLAGVTA